MLFEKAIVLRDKTRLEHLIERFNSKAQARFFLERNGEDFNSYEEEHRKFYEVLNEVVDLISKRMKTKVIDRSFLPTFLFSQNDMVVVLGQDGLVANTAKYVNNLPIIACNPDPDRYDGILLPFSLIHLKKSFDSLIRGQYETEKVTMAEALHSDGQRLLAFNDFYIGASSHVSSRYAISFQEKSENQSSSGIIVSTAAGSTGWLSSVFNMAKNLVSNTTDLVVQELNDLRWEDRKLVFVVREPFKSQMSQTDIGYGLINENECLTVESQMPKNGVIFSDGIEADFLSFNTGDSVTIKVADEKANLVMSL